VSDITAAITAALIMTIYMRRIRRQNVKEVKQ